MTDTSTKPSSTKKKPRKSSRKTFNGIIVLIAALLGLLAAVLGVISANTERTNNDLTDIIAGLEKDKTDLLAENADLQRKLDEALNPTTPPTQPPTTSPTQPSGTPAVWREGPISINRTSRDIDFDAPASDPQWGRNDASGYEEGFHFSGAGYEILITGAGSHGAMLMGTNKPDYDTCRAATNYSREALEVARIVRGTHYCIHTTEDRYAVMTINEAGPDQLETHVVVWDNQP